VTTVYVRNKFIRKVAFSKKILVVGKIDKIQHIANIFTMFTLVVASSETEVTESET
jgi:hypothetical protein